MSYVPIGDEDALAAFQLLARTVGSLPALEPAHALAHIAKVAPTMARDSIILMNLCGRGDKDVHTVSAALAARSAAAN